MEHLKSLNKTLVFGKGTSFQDESNVQINAKIDSFVFLHAPKTGTSFITVLRNYLDACPVKDYTCSAGALGGGFAQENKRAGESIGAFQTIKKDNNAEYCDGKLIACQPELFHQTYNKTMRSKNVVAMLRHPVTTAISDFRWDVYRVMFNLSEAMRDNLTNLEYLYFEKWDSELKARWHRQLKSILAISFLTGSKVSHPPEIVVEAADTLINHVKFYGITEFWQESVCLFHHKFGGVPRDSEYINTRNQGAPEEIPPKLRGALEKVLEVDIKFYEMFLKLFTQEVEKAGCNSG